MKTKFCLIAIMLLLILAACSSPTDPQAEINAPSNATLTQTPSKTATPTSTPAPTHAPTNTSWALWLTPAPIEQSQPTPVFPVPDDQPLGINPADAPTPIPTPSLERKDYQLIEWTPGHALSLVQLIDQHAYDSDIIGAGASRWNYRVAQEWVQVIIQEALLRYPDSPFSEALEWKLARTNLFLDIDEANNWILTTVENGLNSGKYQVEDLHQVFEVNGLGLNLVEVTNLFGSNQDGYFLFTSPGFDGDMLLYALQETETGIFNLIPIISSFEWIYPNGIIDRTGNQIPEFPVIMPQCSLQILEWQGDRFADLGRGEIHGTQSGADCMIRWTPDDPDAVIVAYIILGPTREYTWNGEYYALTSEVYRDEYHLFDVQARLHNRQYQQAIEKIRFVLENWPIEECCGEGVPAGSYTDLLRFDLGISLAYLERSNEAIDVFEQLATTPADPAYPTISQAVEAFLEDYQGDLSTIFAACQAANQVVNTALENTRIEDYHESFKQVFGFNAWISTSLRIEETCDVFPSIEYLIGPISPEDISQVPEILVQAGAKVDNQIWTDLDGDGAEDWILRLASRDLLVVTENHDTLQILDLETGDVRGSVASPEINLEFITPPESTQAVIILYDRDTVGIFQLDKSGSQAQIDWHIDWLAGEIDQLSILDKPLHSEIQVYSSLLESAPEWDSDYWMYFYTYRWDSDQQRYLLVDLPIKVLFEDQDPARAIQVIIEILNNIQEYENQYPGSVVEFNPATSVSFSTLSSEYKARLLYLLGLAYELNGNLNEARKTYYDLWYYYPESPYAIMARAKLEPVSP